MYRPMAHCTRPFDASFKLLRKRIRGETDSGGVTEAQFIKNTASPADYSDDMSYRYRPTVDLRAEVICDHTPTSV